MPLQFTGGEEDNWWCPPLGVVPRLLKHARICLAQGTLIVFLWPSAPYWPILCPNGQFAPFFAGCVNLPRREGLFLPGRSGAVLFGGDVPNTEVLAVRLDLPVLHKKIKGGPVALLWWAHIAHFAVGPVWLVLFLALCGSQCVGPVWLAVLAALSSLNCVDSVWYTISLGWHGSSVIGPEYMGNSVVNQVKV